MPTTKPEIPSGVSPARPVESPPAGAQDTSRRRAIVVASDQHDICVCVLVLNRTKPLIFLAMPLP